MRTIKTSTVLAAAFIGLFVGSAGAQERVVARVPFPFVVRGEEFPAGRYDITNSAGILTIRGMDHGSGVVAMTLPADGRDPLGSKPALVFTHYENMYVLAQIWESSTQGFALVGVSVAPRRAEAPPVASHAPTVVIAANWEVIRLIPMDK